MQTQAPTDLPIVASDDGNIEKRRGKADPQGNKQDGRKRHRRRRRRHRHRREHSKHSHSKDEGRETDQEAENPHSLPVLSWNDAELAAAQTKRTDAFHDSREQDCKQGPDTAPSGQQFWNNTGQGKKVHSFSQRASSAGPKSGSKAPGPQPAERDSRTRTGAPSSRPQNAPKAYTMFAPSLQMYVPSADTGEPAARPPSSNTATKSIPSRMSSDLSTNSPRSPSSDRFSNLFAAGAVHHRPNLSQGSRPGGGSGDALSSTALQALDRHFPQLVIALEAGPYVTLRTTSDAAKRQAMRPSSSDNRRYRRSARHTTIGDRPATTAAGRPRPPMVQRSLDGHETAQQPLSDRPSAATASPRPGQRRPRTSSLSPRAQTRNLVSLRSHGTAGSQHGDSKQYRVLVVDQQDDGGSSERAVSTPVSSPLASQASPWLQGPHTRVESRREARLPRSPHPPASPDNQRPGSKTKRKRKPEVPRTKNGYASAAAPVYGQRQRLSIASPRQPGPQISPLKTSDGLLSPPVAKRESRVVTGERRNRNSDSSGSPRVVDGSEHALFVPSGIVVPHPPTGSRDTVPNDRAGARGATHRSRRFRTAASDTQANPRRPHPALKASGHTAEADARQGGTQQPKEREERPSSASPHKSIFLVPRHTPTTSGLEVMSILDTLAEGVAAESKREVTPRSNSMHSPDSRIAGFSVQSSPISSHRVEAAVASSQSGSDAGDSARSYVLSPDNVESPDHNGLGSGTHKVTVVPSDAAAPAPLAPTPEPVATASKSPRRAGGPIKSVPSFSTQSFHKLTLGHQQTSASFVSAVSTASSGGTTTTTNSGGDADHEAEAGHHLSRPPSAFTPTASPASIPSASPSLAALQSHRSRFVATRSCASIHSQLLWP